MFNESRMLEKSKRGSTCGLMSRWMRFLVLKNFSARAIQSEFTRVDGMMRGKKYLADAESCGRRFRRGRPTLDGGSTARQLRELGRIQGSRRDRAS